ncbi:MAG: hypothetical protein V1908_01660 [Candidatus Peregrinibacteria bacterium]
MPNCNQCQSSFEIEARDREFYEVIDVPDPTLCPDCRRQRRLMFRNFFNLYHRKCDLTGKQIISMYDEHVPFPVYDMHEWWTDKWDPFSYGRDIDFKKPIFEQLKALHNTVPRMSIMNSQCENTDYSNMAAKSRNCYLIFGCVENEDCCYGHIVWKSKNCFDCLYVYRSEFCYECSDCVQCNNLSFSMGCDNCSDSRFLVNCVSCRNCFGCVGIKNKEYHIFNQPYSREDYEKKMKEFNSGNIRLVSMAQKKVQELVGKETVKYYHGFNCENVTGDYLYNCKNTFDSYDLKNCENCRYSATLDGFTNCYDCNFAVPTAEWCYNSLTSRGFRLIGCQLAYDSSNLYYCDYCYFCQDCFGCAGLRNKRYCIFNKQYSKEEYETLLPKLILHMRATNEFGEFFPSDLSPFAYNETIASKYFPLSREEVQAHGWSWKEMDEQKHYKGPRYEIPEDIRDVSDDICKQILVCETTGKLYKIIPQELKFYREMNLPIPHQCPDERHNNRMKSRNPRHLWTRVCAKCSKPIQTTYSPDRPEKVYCEECYLKSVY